MNHITVYRESGIYAGWPANHGAWQWGDEFLVGLLRGKYSFCGSGMHSIAEPYQKCLARSMDGGATWVLEIPNVDFEPVACWPAPSFNLDETIIRACGVYDTGGDYCPDGGAFYLSSDRGHIWSGPFEFTGIEMRDWEQGTARTSVLGNLLFMSSATSGQWGTDQVFVARHDGSRFSRVASFPEMHGRCVMPVAVRTGGRIVAVCRRKQIGIGNCWVDAFASDDDGETWKLLSRVGETGGYNGNPPALVALQDGSIVCAFANRSDCAVYASKSSDGGVTWSWPIVVRSDGNTDIGYPQLLLRSDGVPVCIYYWADAINRQQHIVATALEALQ